MVPSLKNEHTKKKWGSAFLGRMSLLFFGKMIPNDPEILQCLKSKYELIYILSQTALNLDSLAKKQLAHEPPFENHESNFAHSLIPVSDLKGCIRHRNPGAAADANQNRVAEHSQLVNMESKSYLRTSWLRVFWINLHIMIYTRTICRVFGFQRL